ncbi:MAG: hypothetical protein RI922_2698 [Bacteroidota bacterium]|jgi:hypothetical protein
MLWGKYIGFFGFSMIKFLFTPFGGPKAGLSFIETYVVCVAGALVSAAIFYFSSEFFLIRAHKKRKELLLQSIETGIPLKQKKKFTKTNKLIVRIKHKLGIIGVSFYAPLFLSIPIGTIITAKFYGKEKRTFPLIILGIGINGVLTTGTAYIIADFF